MDYELAKTGITYIPLTKTLKLNLEKMNYLALEKKDLCKYDCDVIEITESKNRTFDDTRYEMLYYFFNTSIKAPKKCYINCTKIYDDDYIIRDLMRTYFDKLHLWQETELYLHTRRPTKEVKASMVLGKHRVGQYFPYTIEDCKSSERDPYYEKSQINKKFVLQTEQTLAF